MGTLLLAGSVMVLPAHADNTVTVGGHTLSASGLETWGAECDPDEPTRIDPIHPFTDAAWWQMTPLYRAGGTIGTHAIGWSNRAETVSGPAAFTGSPGELTTIRASFYSPSGGEQGRIVVFYDNNPADLDGGEAFVGVGTYEIASSGWQTVDLGAQKLTWWTVFPNAPEHGAVGWWHDGGTPWANTHTVSGFDLNLDNAAPHNASAGDYAKVGLLMGCSGNPFYVDQLVIGGPGQLTTYDFEGVPTSAHIWSPNPAGSQERDRKAVTLDTGKGAWLGLDAYARGENGQPNSWVSNGQYQLYARPYDAPGFIPVAGASGEFRQNETAYYLAAPKRTTTYELRYRGADSYEPSFSTQVVVSVRSAVVAKVKDRTLVQGRQPLVVAGKILPKTKGVKVKLQRQVGKRWKTIAKQRTTRKGAFSLSAPVLTAGKWKVRVLVAKGPGTLGTTSTTKTVNVKRYVPPPPPPRDKVDYFPAPSAPVQEVAPKPGVLEADPPVTVRGAVAR